MAQAHQVPLEDLGICHGHFAEGLGFIPFLGIIKFEIAPAESRRGSGIIGAEAFGNPNISPVI